MRPQRSLRLEKRSAKSLDTLSGASGEIFYDVDSATLRIYTNNANEKVVLATRSWTTTEIENNAFSGLYADLIGAPTALSSFTNNVGYITLADLPPAEAGGAVQLNELLDVEIDTPALGQLLEYDGSKWINTTVAGLTDTNTTYSLDLTSVTNGVDLDLVDSNAISDIITLLGGTGITVSVTNTNEVTIDNTGSAPAMNDITDVTVALPEDGHVLQYNSGLWINTAPTGGIALTDFSITTSPASGEGSLSYNNANGVFTFTPPDVSAAGIALTDLSVLTSTANAGGSLTYNNTTGEFTFRPADLSGLSADLVNDTTPQLGGDLELNTNDIVGSGNIDITGTGTFTGAISAPEFINTGVGAPVITSASTITLTAPDGVTIDGDLDVTGTVTGITLTAADVGLGNVTNESKATMFTDPTFTGTVTTSALTSASTITLTAPNGIIFGGDLDLNGKEIQFTGASRLTGYSGNDIEITSYGNSEDAGNPGNISLKTWAEGGTRGDVIIQDLKYPQSDGTNGQVLTTDGSGTLSFENKNVETLDPKTGATGTVTHDLNTAAVFYHSSISANFTANFTNADTTNNKTTSIALVLAQGATAFMSTGVQIGGVAQPIIWQGGSAPTGTASGTDVVSFTLIRTGSAWTVIGSGTSYS